MLGYLEGKVSDRKLRLFVCACCRYIWLNYPECCSLDETLDIAESFADRAATPSELAPANKDIDRAKYEMSYVLNSVGDSLEIAFQSQPMNVEGAARAAKLALGFIDRIDWRSVTGESPELRLSTERASQCDRLRCLFGPLPFRSISPSGSWLTPTVMYVAQTIYSERDFDALPLFAEALEQSGCDEPEILDHCREQELHVRGCWVV
jgi:hypothetical protein